MTFLTKQEYRTVNALNVIHARELTPIELLIKTIKDGTYDPKAVLGELDRYVENDYHRNKVKAVVEDPSKLPELLESYPLVEFYEAITHRKYGKYVELGLALNEVNVENAVSLINHVSKTIESLPLGVDSFVGTPHTEYGAMRREYEANKDRKFLGLVVSNVNRVIVNSAFSYMSTRIWNNIIEHDLANDKEIFRRMRMEQHVREDGYKTIFDFENINIAGSYIKTPVLVIRVMDKEKQLGRYWFVLPH